MSTEKQAKAVTAYITDSLSGAYQLDDIIGAFLDQFKPSLELNMGFNGIFHGELPHVEMALRKELVELYPRTDDIEMRVESKEIKMGKNAGLAHRAVFAAIDEYCGNLNEVEEVIAQRKQEKKDVFRVIDEAKKPYASLSQYSINGEQFSLAKELQTMRLLYTNFYTKLQKIPGVDEVQIKAYEHRKDRVKEDTKKLSKDSSATDLSKYLLSLKQAAEIDVISAVKQGLEYLFRHGLATEVNLNRLSETNQYNLAVAKDFKIKLEKQIRVAKESRCPVGQEATVFEQVSQQLLKGAESVIDYLEMQNKRALSGFFLEDRARGATLELRTIAESIISGKSTHPRLTFVVKVDELPDFSQERNWTNYAEEAAKQKERADSAEEIAKDEAEHSQVLIGELNIANRKLDTAHATIERLKRKQQETPDTAAPTAAAPEPAQPAVVAVLPRQKKKKGTLDTVLDTVYNVLTIGGMVPSPGEILSYVTGRGNKGAKYAQANNVVQYTGLNRNDARYTATPAGIRQMYADLRTGADSSEIVKIVAQGTARKFGENFGAAKVIMLELSRFKRGSITDVSDSMNKIYSLMQKRGLALEEVLGLIKSAGKVRVSEVPKDIESRIPVSGVM